MMELFPGQAERELLRGHIPRAPEAIERYKTPLSLAKAAKDAEIQPCYPHGFGRSRENKTTRSQLMWMPELSQWTTVLFGGEWGRKINILSVLSEVSVSEHRLWVCLKLQAAFFSTGFHVSLLSLDFLPGSLQFPCFSPPFTALTIYSCPCHKNCSGLSSSLYNGTLNWTL